jgi:hypothetical protein
MEKANTNIENTNLLSKVMFLDTFTSGENAGSGTLNKQLTTKSNQRHVQINDTQRTKFNTQTRRDLEDLEEVSLY